MRPAVLGAVDLLLGFAVESPLLQMNLGDAVVGGRQRPGDGGPVLT